MSPGVRLARLLPAAGTVAALAVLPGCAAPASEPRQLVVYAAASLSGVFEDLAEDFQAATGTSVALHLAGSSDLLAQLRHGATADVLATADERTMRAASEAGLVAGDPRVFARNSLAVVLAPGNPAAIEALDDLAGDALVAVCAPQVPCGTATRTLAERAGIPLSPATEESSVRDVLAKVATGEADAGIVYDTDARRAPAAVGLLEIPPGVNVTTSYPIATLVGADEPGAGGFVDFVLSSAGSRRLAGAGFEVAP